MAKNIRKKLKITNKNDGNYNKSGENYQKRTKNYKQK